MSSPPSPHLSLIAAVARNGAIGRDNDLLWSDPADQRHFRQTTMGWPVVMGRRTWESLPARFRPLPGRRNVVVTHNAGFVAAGAETATSLDAALVQLHDSAHVFVIGGGALYGLALPRADTLVITEIDADLEGDTFFPAIDRLHFQEVERRPQESADGTRFAFVTYRRRSAPAA